METRLTELPQPSKSTRDIYEISAAVVTTLVPPLAAFKAGADILIRKRLEAGQALLLEEIRSSGVDALSNEKWDYYLPAAYRFFEQVRLGEYEHNLSVLAKLIAGDLRATDPLPDIGKIGRAASKLEMLPKEVLIALSRCERAFEIYETTDECDGYWICIDAPELIASFAEVGVDVKAIQCQEWLHELGCRGILTSSDRPSRIGGTFYYRSSVYREIIQGAKDLGV